MVRKRGLMSFVLIFAFVILSFNLISAAGCIVVSGLCGGAYPYPVMKLSATTNAHGALWNQGTYNRYLCCDFPGTHTCFSNNNNTILRLSAVTNAHAEIKTGTIYPDVSRVCFGNLTCTNLDGACNVNYPIEMVSLSGLTNAHIAQFSSTYPTKICCRFAVPAPWCGDGSVTFPEDCDTANLGGASCLSLGYDGGTLACYLPSTLNECTFDTSLCTDCGDGICEGAEQCDDGNNVNGDGCSSTCTVESGYSCSCSTIAPSCCYDTTPGYSWLKNGANFNSGGKIRQGDILTMRFNEDFCKPSGAGTTFYIREGTTTRASAGSTVVSGLPGTTTSTYTSALSFLQALGTETSQILFRTTVDGNTYNSNTITVDPVYCGDGVCDSVAPDTENCGNCPADCGCVSPQICESNMCVDPCDITSVSWSVSTPNVASAILAGTPVKVNIAGTNCNGKTITFEVREQDGVGTDAVASAPSPVIFPSSGTTASSSDWSAVYQDDSGFGNDGNPPEYYVIATVSGVPYTESEESSNSGVNDPALLRVTIPAPCGDGTCDSGIGENCVTCPDDCICGGATPICDIPTQTCVAECVLDSKFWSKVTAVDGEVVQLTTSGTNCNGETVTFEILEYDTIGGDDPVEYPSTPVSVVMSGGQATVSWTAEWPGYNNDDIIGNTREYYFIPRITALGKELTAKNPRLSVTSGVIPPSCPDGDIDSGEICDCGPEGSCTLAELNGETCASRMGAGYTGTLGCYSDCSGFDTSECVPPPCDITYAEWSIDTPVGSPVPEGTPVRVNIVGTNCADKTITFEVREQDGVGTDAVASAPSPVTFPSSGTTASSSDWSAVYQDDSGFGNDGNPPEYYVIVRVQGESESYTTSNSGVNDPELLRVTIPPPNCPDGDIDIAESCDCGPEGSCTLAELDNKECEDVIPGSTGTLGCTSSCGFDTSGCCLLTAASWSQPSALGGNTVRLNVEGTAGCDGMTIEFEVKEDDSVGDDDVETNPDDIIYGSPSTYGTWTAEWPGYIDGETDPEYYFIARVKGTTTEVISNLLDVSEAAAVCAGINICSDYTDSDQCNNDGAFCNVGEYSVELIKGEGFCGITSDALCTYDTTCGCYWNITEDMCEPRWDTETNCMETECGNDILEPGEDCDSILLMRLNDLSCSNFDDYTSGTIGCYAPGSSYECTYNFSICATTGDPYCGNGVLDIERGETCDDGNTASGDGCDDNCQDETSGSVCGDGILDTTYEQCDPNPSGSPLFRLGDPRCDLFDAYTSGTITCNDECTYDFSGCITSAELCGNGVLDDGEECDDGDRDNGDGCDENCQYEGGTTAEKKVGECFYFQKNEDLNGCDDGIIERILGHYWVWDPANIGQSSNPGEGYVQDLNDGLWYYDPDGKMAECVDKEYRMECPAAVQVPFFGIYQFVIAFALVGLIYLAYFLKNKK